MVTFHGAEVLTDSATSVFNVHSVVKYLESYF